MQRAELPPRLNPIRLRDRRSAPVVASAAGLHPRETALLSVVSLHLVLLPWALGTMQVWSQCLSLGLGMLSLILALLPRSHPGPLPAGSPRHEQTLPTLLRFPLFWSGLIFLLYTAVQGLNPAWTHVPTSSGFWLKGTSHVPWLPTGTRTPFADSSPWRALVIYGSVWLSACATWAGLTRRHALRTLLVVLAINAFLLAVLGLLQRAGHADKIFWSWTPPAEYFVSSFIYRNHAGAYFNLMLAVASALAFAYFSRRSGAGAMFVFFSAVIAEIVLCSFSRGAISLMAVFLAATAGFIGRQILAAPASRRPRRSTLLAGAALVLTMIGGLFLFQPERLVGRMKDLRAEVDAGSGNTRIQLDEATWSMFLDEPVLGWGAGSFRYIFPGYQVRHPGIMVARDSGRHLIFEHAHNDYLELLAEYGVVGSGILASGLVLCLVRLIRLGVWREPPVLFLLAGCLITMAHAAFDFPFANPAVLITWACLWPVMLRWLEAAQRSNALSASASAGA